MKKWAIVLAIAALSACGTASDTNETKSQATAPSEMSVSNATSAPATGEKIELAGSPPFDAYSFASFDEPWAMTFMPNGQLLVTEKSGQLLIVEQSGTKIATVGGTPEVDYGGQGGLGDVVLHPEFAENNIIYLSFAEAGDDDTRGAAVLRAKLEITNAYARLTDSEVIWRQTPKVTGRGHFGHRIAFSDDGYLFISSGDRQKFDPAQDMNSTMGKVVRLNDDGSTPADNPFADQGGVTSQIWSFGHRNPLGLSFDVNGQLWNSEMGPRHGDELNAVKPGNNYGYPLVSNGDHYNGDQIPDHDTRPDLVAPAAYWVPAISPAGLMIYSGDLFDGWTNNAFLGGLSSKALIRVELDGDQAKEVARYPMNQRIREIEQGPDGAIWLLEDLADGRLLKLVPNS
ncbi:MAG: PQQ-dependent sugar dehydrogenase [Woeseiaceae bacterium]